MAGYGNFLKKQTAGGYNYSTGSIQYLFDNNKTYLISLPFTASNKPDTTTLDDYYSKFGYRTPAEIDNLFENNIVKISTILPPVANDYYNSGKISNLSVIKYDGQWIGKYQKIEPWHAIYVTTNGMVDSTISGSLIPGNYKTSLFTGDGYYVGDTGGEWDNRITTVQGPILETLSDYEEVADLNTGTGDDSEGVKRSRVERTLSVYRQFYGWSKANMDIDDNNYPLSWLENQ